MAGPPAIEHRESVKLLLEREPTIRRNSLVIRVEEAVKEIACFSCCLIRLFSS